MYIGLGISGLTSQPGGDNSSAVSADDSQPPVLLVGVRKAGEERAVGRVIMHAATRKRKPEPRYITTPASELIEGLTRTFQDTTARAQ